MSSRASGPPWSASPVDRLVITPLVVAGAVLPLLLEAAWRNTRQTSGEHVLEPVTVHLRALDPAAGGGRGGPAPGGGRGAAPLRTGTHSVLMHYSMVLLPEKPMMPSPVPPVEESASVIESLCDRLLAASASVRAGTST